MMRQEHLKRELRASMEAARREMSELERQSGSASICRHLFELVERCSSGQRGGFTVMCYMPFRGEADISPFIARLWAAGYTVAAPKADRRNRQLDIHLIRDMADLEAGSWGIPEPKAYAQRVDSLAAIDAIVVPGLGFDRDGGRLGYGGGYYDRLFRRFEAAGLDFPVRIGVCFERQLADRIPMEAHDYSVDAVVTEEGVRTPAVKRS